MTGLVFSLVLFLVIGFGFIFVHLVAGKFIRPAKPDAEKLTIYECGEPTIGSTGFNSIYATTWSLSFSSSSTWRSRSSSPGPSFSATPMHWQRRAGSLPRSNGSSLLGRSCSGTAPAK